MTPQAGGAKPEPARSPVLEGVSTTSRPWIAKRTVRTVRRYDEVVTAGSLSLAEMAQLNRYFRRIFRVTRGPLARAARRRGPESGTPAARGGSTAARAPLL